MTDRELLELAAKAAGLRYIKPSADYSGALGLALCDEHGRLGQDWSPLADDGDALRLAVKLRIWLDYSGCGDVTPSHICAKYLGIRGRASSIKWAHVEYVPDEMFVSGYLPDQTHAAYQLEQGIIRGLEPATRRAVVRAAAEIGKAMP